MVPRRRRSEARHVRLLWLVLIGVHIHGAEFLEVDKPSPVIVYELVKGWLTGTEPELGKMHAIKGSASSR